MGDLRFLTAGDVLQTNLYIQFKVNLHDADDVSQIFTIGSDISAQSSTPYVYQDTGDVKLAGAFSQALSSVFTLDEWHTFEMCLCVVPPMLVIGSAKFDGAALTPSGQIYAVMIANFQISNCWFGAANATDVTVNHHIKDIKIGTAGFGSDNLFSFDLNAALLSDSLTPQFDSVTGDGMSITSEGILFENDGSDVYATKALVFP